MAEAEIKQEQKAGQAMPRFDKYTLALIAILAFSFLIRIYYFVITKGQALWWDEAEYINIAGRLGGDLPFYNINVQRPLLFSVLELIILNAGLGEYAMKFLLVILPSVAIVLLTYFLGKELYGRKAAIYSAAFMSFFWLLLFETNRLLTDVFAMMLGALAIFFFWKGYVKKERAWYVWLAGVMIALAFGMRLMGFITAFAILLFLIVVDRTGFLKEKNLWIAAALGAVTLSPYLIWLKINYGSPLASVAANTQGIASKFSWYVLKFIPWYTKMALLVVFIFGIAYLFYELVIGRDLIKKERKLQAHILNLAGIFVYYFYFIFVLRPVIMDDRWLLPTALPIALIIGFSLTKVENILSKYGKTIAIAAVVLILAVGAYEHLRLADSTINNSKFSYAQEKPAGLWLKENTKPDDLIMSSNDQTAYIAYSGRHVTSIGAVNEQDFLNNVMRRKPQLLVLSAYPPRPGQWAYEFPQKHAELLEPVQVFYEGQQPVIVIYKFKNWSL